VNGPGSTCCFHNQSCTLKFFPIASALIVVAACAGAVKRQEVAIPPGDAGATRPAAGETVPQAELQELYRAELGPAYDPVQSDQLDAAHQLLEKYFEAHLSAGRMTITKSLQATGIDTAILGRLCRIRAHWPALAGGGFFYINQRNGPFVLRYFLGIPKTYDRSHAWPLVLRLPDLTPFYAAPPPDAQRVVEMYRSWISEELAKHADAVVLMPLLNLDELYGPGYAGMNSVIQPMLDAADRVNIDPARVYMVGHSVGAIGVWNLALHYPTYFAAINPLAGAASQDWQRLRLMNLRNVLPVVWHDDSDKLIKVNFSKSLVTALRDMKIEVDFDETRKLGHTPDKEILDSEYARMRARVRKLYPVKVWLQTNRPEVVYNRNDWVQIYQEQTTGKEHRLYFRTGTGHMTVYPNPCSIKAELSNNQITASVDNVSTLRFYVNDQMVNMASTVTVVINHKLKFQGVVKPDLDQMLKDQLYLGRGWRYYCAAIDIDMTSPTTQPSTQPVTRPATRAVHKGTITVGPSRSQ
jgi:hypothetical protein